MIDARATSRTPVSPQNDVEAVFRQQADRLWRSLTASFGSRDLADEAVGEAFAQLIRRGSAVRDAERWVWRAAFKIASGLAARRAREVAWEPWDRPIADAEPPWALLSALRELSSMQRSSLVLHYYAGYPAADVARLLGSTAPAVRVHMMRGRRRLRALLEEDGP